jgi:hypothetical protein
MSFRGYGGFQCNGAVSPSRLQPRQVRGCQFKDNAANTPSRSFNLREFIEAFASRSGFTMQSDSAFAAAVYVAARETPIWPVRSMLSCWNPLTF